MKKQAIGLVLALATLFGATSQASAITVSEYNSLSTQMKGKAMNLIVNGTYKNLSSQKVENSKLQCVSDLFTPTSTNGISKGVDYIYEELGKASSSTRVEDIVLGVMDRECDSTNTAKIPKPSKSEPG